MLRSGSCRSGGTLFPLIRAIVRSRSLGMSRARPFASSPTMACTSEIKAAPSVCSSFGRSSEPQPATSALQTVSETASERLGESRIPYLLLRLFDRVGDAPEAGGPLGSVDEKPGSARVAVARLPDRAGVDEETPVVEFDGYAPGREPSVDPVAVQRERERDVRMTDEHDRLGRRLEREQRDVLAQHVLPNGVARARVEQLGAVAACKRHEGTEPGALRVAENAGRPPRGGRRVAA